MSSRLYFTRRQHEKNVLRPEGSSPSIRHRDIMLLRLFVTKTNRVNLNLTTSYARSTLALKLKFSKLTALTLPYLSF